MLVHDTNNKKSVIDYFHNRFFHRIYGHPHITECEREDAEECSCLPYQYGTESETSVENILEDI